MSAHDDDFWGTLGDWTPTSPRPDSRAAGFPDAHRTRPLAVVRRGLSNLLGGGVNPTREHGIVRPAAATHDPFDDPFDDDLDQAIDHPTGAHRVAPPLIVPAPEPRRELTRELLRTMHDHDVAPTRAQATHRTRTHAAPFADRDDRRTDDVSSLSSRDHRGDDDLAFAGLAASPTNDVAADVEYHSWDEDFEPVRPGTALDPLLGRLGALAVVTALLVPLALSFGSNGSDTLLESATSPTTVPALAVDATATSVAVPPFTADQVAAAPPAASGSAAQESAPPAAPVSTPAADDSASAASTAAAATAPTDSSSTVSDQGALQASPAGADVPAAVETRAERVDVVCSVDYEVVAGDYWIRLADGAGVSLADLLDANGASVSTPLFPGQTICLPAGSTTPPPPPTIPVTAPPTTAPATTAPPTTAPPTTTPSTTAPPTTTPTTTTTVPASSRSVQQIIRDVWPDELEERALEIAWRESNYIPTAQNFCCYGIFQIYWNVHKSWLDDIGITDAQQLFDPETNIRAAYALYQRAGGWGPWSL